MRFNKIIRPASEFIILSILAENKELHPYEVQNKLQEKIIKMHEQRIAGLVEMVEICELIISSFKKNKLKHHSELNALKKQDESSLFKFLADTMFSRVRENNEIINEISIFIKGAKNILLNLSAKLRIWESIPAIYQVINDLEKRKLINVARTEYYKGRIRKIYKITNKGRLEALQMLYLFGDLTQVITPNVFNFQKEISFFFQNHIRIFLEFIHQLFPNEPIINVIKGFEENHPNFKKILNSVSPMLDNDSITATYLSNDQFSISNLKLEKLNPDEADLFKHLLISRLKEYRTKVDESIKFLEK